MSRDVSDMQSAKTADPKWLGALIVAMTTFSLGLTFSTIQSYFAGPEDPAKSRDTIFSIAIIITLGLTAANVLGFYITLPLYYLLAIPCGVVRIIVHSAIAAVLALGFLVTGVPEIIRGRLMGQFESNSTALFVMFGIMTISMALPFLAAILLHFVLWRAHMKLIR